MSSEGLICKDFVFQTDDNIHLHGDYPHINCLLSCVESTTYKVRLAMDNTSLPTLNTSIISLSPPPVSLDRLLGIVQSDHYVQVAHRIAMLSGNGKDSEVTQSFGKLMHRRDLRHFSVAVLRVALLILSDQEGLNYQLGVLKPCGQYLGQNHYQVHIHEAPHGKPDRIIWTFFDDDARLDPFAFSNDWSAVAPVFRTSAELKAPLANISNRANSRAGASMGMTPVPSQSRERSQSSGFDDSEFIPQKASKKKRAPMRKVESSFDSKLKASKRVIDAPPRESQLPLDHITDITIADLIIYYPEHVTNWPGLALLVNHYNICRPIGRQGWACKIADMINKSRGLEKSHVAAVSRHNLRNWSVEAVEKLLGVEYNTTEAEHTKALYNSVEAEVGRKPAGSDIKGFFQAHLFDLPQNVDRVMTALPLAQVGTGVHTHLDTPFGLRVQQAMRDGIDRPGPQMQGKYHPLLSFIGDDTKRTSKEKLDRTVYPWGYDEDELIKDHLKDLHGEPLLFIHRKFEISTIIRKIEHYHGITGKQLNDLYSAFRKRKATALKLRAERLGLSHDVVLARYEIEAAELGNRTGRMPRHAQDKAAAAREILAHRAQRARATGKPMAPYPPNRKMGSEDARLVAEVAGDVPMGYRSRRRRQQGSNSPPPLPPMSAEASRCGSLADAEGDSEEEHGYSKPIVPSAEYIVQSIERPSTHHPQTSFGRLGLNYTSFNDDPPPGVRHRRPSVPSPIVPTGARMNFRFDSFDPLDSNEDDISQLPFQGSPKPTQEHRLSKGLSSLARDIVSSMPAANQNSPSCDPFNIESVLHGSPSRDISQMPFAYKSGSVQAHSAQDPALFNTQPGKRKRRRSQPPSISTTATDLSTKRLRSLSPKIEADQSQAPIPKPAVLVRRASSLMRAMAQRPVFAPDVGTVVVVASAGLSERKQEAQEGTARDGSASLDSLDALFEGDDDEFIGPGQM